MRGKRAVPDPRRREFALAYMRTGSALAAHSEVYGTMRYRGAYRMLRAPDVQQVIAEVQGSLDALAAMSREEVLDRLVGIIDATPSDAHPDNPLCELSPSGSLVFPSKLAALKELARICGYNEPDKVEVSATDDVVEMIRAIAGVRAKSE